MNSINCLNMDSCTGCGLCFNICPKNAIHMQENFEGFLEPVVDIDSCIDCGLCLKLCPQVNREKLYSSTSKVYSVICKDSIRDHCSSGGVFGAVAKWAVNQGGVVYGADFDKDFRGVHHEKAIDENGIIRLCKSKYLQSNIGNVYQEIKKNLEETSAPLIFCGCPCQVDALRRYLKHDYVNLFVIDILCHGVASPLAYRKFLDEIFEDVDSPITSVDFRSKKYGWACNVVITAEDGTTRISPHNGSYFNAFLWGYSQRKACFDCKYASQSRVGDITIGDFWGVNEVMPEMYDGRGTSLVMCNNPKGQELLSNIGEYLSKIQQCDLDKVLEVAQKYNWAMIKPGNMPTYRGSFFYRLSKGDRFSQAFRYAGMPPYDVGIFGWWFEDEWTNYGSTLTYYALMEYVSSLGLSVCMITSPYHDAKKASDFIRKHGYVMSQTYSFENFYKHNEKIKMFLLGSDQLWFYNCYKGWGHALFLDFVSEEKKKIAYATSFGHKEPKIPATEIPVLKRLLSKFDAISVRENDGIEILKDLFEVDAVQNVDPVFLCDIKHWDEISENAVRKTKGNFIFAYMLDPTEKKKDLLDRISKKLRMSIVSITDKQYDKERKESELSEFGVIKEASIEELIYHLKNANYIVTDSYHGTCFSLIFKKVFCTIVNAKRGTSRFDTLSALFDVEKHFIYDLDKVNSIEGLLVRPDYSKISMLIEHTVNKSKAWLNYQLFQEKNVYSGGGKH